MNELRFVERMVEVNPWDYPDARVETRVRILQQLQTVSSPDGGFSEDWVDVPCFSIEEMADE